MKKTLGFLIIFIFVFFNFENNIAYYEESSTTDELRQQLNRNINEINKEIDKNIQRASWECNKYRISCSDRINGIKKAGQSKIDLLNQTYEIKMNSIKHSSEINSINSQIEYNYKNDKKIDEYLEKERRRIRSEFELERQVLEQERLKKVKDNLNLKIKYFLDKDLREFGFDELLNLRFEIEDNLNDNNYPTLYKELIELIKEKRKYDEYQEYLLKKDSAINRTFEEWKEYDSNLIKFHEEKDSIKDSVEKGYKKIKINEYEEAELYFKTAMLPISSYDANVGLARSYYSRLIKTDILTNEDFNKYKNFALDAVNKGLEDYKNDLYLEDESAGEALKLLKDIKNLDYDELIKQEEDKKELENTKKDEIKDDSNKQILNEKQTEILENTVKKLSSLYNGLNDKQKEKFIQLIKTKINKLSNAKTNANTKLFLEQLNNKVNTF